MILMDPNYSNLRYLARVTLARPIPFNKYQTAAQLPTEALPASSSVILSGWGSTEFNSNSGKTGPYSQYLQKLEVQVLELQQCANLLNGIHRTAISPGKFCGYSPDGADGCYGDSGSPLTYNGRILVGISSYGFGCGIGYPNFNVHVYYYRQWIQETFKKLDKL